jgi:hypothetical protein
LHTRFRKGQSGNPGGRSQKKLHALLADALDEQVFVTVDGERRKITKREADSGSSMGMVSSDAVPLCPVSSLPALSPERGSSTRSGGSDRPWLRVPLALFGHSPL